jgi:hypothetical protein
MWAGEPRLRAQNQYCGLRCNQCEPEALPRINDCGPERVLYCEPSVQLVRAATPNHTVLAKRANQAIKSHRGDMIENRTEL